MKKEGLSTGSCTTGKYSDDNRLITIEQHGEVFRYEFKQSENAKYIVAWKSMLNFIQENSNQVCLIENGRKIVWADEFRRAERCEVSNDGTVVVLDLNPTPINYKGTVAYQNIDLIFVIFKNGQKIRQDFGDKAEIMAFALSPDSNFLVYNLQQYRPDNYQLVLQNLKNNKEEWRYKYPKNQVIHQLVFKGNRILVYSGPRPSAFVDRRYSFTLDLEGRLVENDPSSTQAQEECDLKAALANKDATKICRILTDILTGVAPTIETETEKQLGPKRFSPAMTRIMKGERSLPALYITLRSVPDDLQAQSKKTEIEEKAHRFFLHIEVLGKTPEERDRTADKCLKTLDEKEEAFGEKNLAIVTTPSIRVINAYPGSGPYPRSNVSAIVAFPSKERRKKVATFESVFTLQHDESVITINDVIIKAHGIRVEGKIALTTQSLYLFMKNPVSGSYSASSGIPPKKGKKILFGQDESGKYLDRNGIRVYFKVGSQEFETFKKQFNSWVKRA
jgi:hypothetical protein